eukprot:s3065_g12.t1
MWHWEMGGCLLNRASVAFLVGLKPCATASSLSSSIARLLNCMLVWIWRSASLILSCQSGMPLRPDANGQAIHWCKYRLCRILLLMLVALVMLICCLAFPVTLTADNVLWMNPNISDSQDAMAEADLQEVKGPHGLGIYCTLDLQRAQDIGKTVLLAEFKANTAERGVPGISDLLFSSAGGENWRERGYAGVVYSPTELCIRVECIRVLYRREWPGAISWPALKRIVDAMQDPPLALDSDFAQSDTAWAKAMERLKSILTATMHLECK